MKFSGVDDTTLTQSDVFCASILHICVRLK
jgi:hypothetical protein